MGGKGPARGPAAEDDMPEFAVKEVGATPYLFVEQTSAMDPDEIARAMGAAFGAVLGFMQREAIAPAGPPLAVYHEHDPTRLKFRAGLIVRPGDLHKAEAPVLGETIPAGRVLHFVHKGPYATLRDDYDAMMVHLAAEGLTLGSPTWEVYVDDPGEVPEADLLTEVYTRLG